MLLLHYIQAVILVARTLAQTCSVTSNTDGRLHTKHGRRLREFKISHLLHFQLSLCALECLLVKKCKSFNYKELSGFCELNSVNLDEVSITFLKERYSFEYHDIRGWPAEMAGTCASRPCGGNQRCIPSTVYICVDIALVTDCKAVKQCNPTYGDGHYWIHLYGLDKIKVYCHDMDFQPKVYLTLPYPGNYAEGEVRTEFRRVRLNIYQGGQIAIRGSDFTFATFAGVPTPFGQAGICRTTNAGTESIGGFSVNLTGTGMRIIQDSWAVPEGINFRRAASGVILAEGRCFGICEHCVPSKHIFIFPVTDTDVDAADTVYPVCTTDHGDFV